MSIVEEVIIEDSFFHVEPVSSPNYDDFHSNNPIIEKIGQTVSRTNRKQNRKMLQTQLSKGRSK